MSTIITHKTFPNYRKYEMDLAGRPFSIEVGKVAELANAAAMVKYGETTVMVAVKMCIRDSPSIVLLYPDAARDTTPACGFGRQGL